MRAPVLGAMISIVTVIVACVVIDTALVNPAILFFPFHKLGVLWIVVAFIKKCFYTVPWFTVCPAGIPAF